MEVYKPIYARIAKFAEAGNLSIKDCVNQVLDSYLSTLEFTKKRFTEINQVGSTDTAILMEDKGKNAIATITMKIEDGSMFCSVCKKNFCEHIFRSLYLPDWIKIMKNLDRMRDEAIKDQGKKK